MTASRPRIAQGHRKNTGHRLRSARSAAKRLQPDEPPRRSTARDPLPEPGTELELDGGSKGFGCIAFGLEASKVIRELCRCRLQAVTARRCCRETIVPMQVHPRDRIVPDASERNLSCRRFIRTDQGCKDRRSGSSPDNTTLLREPKRSGLPFLARLASA